MKKKESLARKAEKKILLVYPKIPPTYWSFKYALPFIGKKASIPPLGLLTIAALLPSLWDIQLIDMNVSVLTDKILEQADLVMISAMIIQKQSFAEIVERCKGLNVPIAAGGPYPTSLYKSIQGVKYFILNEAEITLSQFLKDLEKGEAKKVYSSSDKADITTTPLPRFDLLPMSDYASMALQYSRGCPFNCEFCDIIEMFGRKIRTKTSRQMIEELNLLYSLGWRGSVFIVDDNFIGNKRDVKHLLPVIAEWQKQRDYPFNFFTEASVNLGTDPELLEMMCQAGFNMVFLGIETPVEETLTHTGKMQNAKRNLMESVTNIQNKGIEVTGGFIVGFDSDPSDIFERQIQFIQQSGIALAMVGLLNALPNTQLYKRLEKEGRLLEDSSGNNTHDLQLNFKTKMNPEKIIAGYKQIIASIYDPKSYFERCLTSLREFQPHQNSSRRVKGEEIYALFVSLIRQTFSSYGYYYWRYLIKAFFISPQMFPEAVCRAIVGHHLFKITRQILAVEEFKTYAEKIKSYYEGVIQTRMKRLKETQNELDKKLAELQALKKEAIKNLQRKAKKIHIDFRYLVSETLQTIENDLNQWLQITP